MKWEAAPSVSGNETYHLYKDDRKILTLNLHSLSNSARIEFDNEKRVILIRKEGFRKKKIVLRSEYGIKIGELGHENKLDFIEVNKERFYYTIQNNPLAELVLYKESVNKPVVTCSLDTNNGKASIEFSKAKNPEIFAHSGLLTALCWYIHLPVTRETVTEFTR